MQHILVPVDLSPNSKAAVRYAAHIAFAAKAGMTIVFGYNLLDKAIRYTTKKGQVDKDPEVWIQKRIDKIHAKRPEVEIEYKIIKGDILDIIKRLAQTTEADLIIMGCQGKDENPENYLGSLATAVIKTSSIPVLAIPPKFKFRGIHKISLAVDNPAVTSSVTLATLDVLKKIFQPHVELLRAGTGNEPSETPDSSLTTFADEVIRMDSNFYKENIIAHLDQHFTSLLVVIRRQNGFLEKILGPGRTPREIFNINMPLLVLIDKET